MRLISKILCIVIASLTTMSVMAQSAPSTKADSTAVEDSFVMP